MILATQKIRLIMELRRMGVMDTQVLSAIETTPRELFVSPTFLDKAYDNTALPIECGQTISQPYIVAKMTESLKLTKRMKVLEVGTGSGYQSVILAKLCRRLYTIEYHKALLKAAEARFQHLRISNITSKCGDGWQGWKEQAPFERIIVTAAPDEIPQELVEQLSIGGIMIIPVGVNQQTLYKVTKTEEGIETTPLESVKFVPLVKHS